MVGYPLPQASDLGPNPPLVTSGGDHWRSVQTFLFGDLAPRVTSGGGHWNWMHVRFPNGRYTSYWNALLFFLTKVSILSPVE